MPIRCRERDHSPAFLGQPASIPNGANLMASKKTPHPAATIDRNQ
jgi:hypothetical protein